MNRQELYIEAKREIARHRQRAQDDALRRRAQLEEALPGLVELDRRRGAMGAMAARLAADGQQAEAREKLSEMHALAAQRAEMLHAVGSSERDLEPRYDCAACEDTGIADGRVCGCVHREVLRLRRAEINAESPLTISSFDTFDPARYPERMEGYPGSPRRDMAALLQECRDYVATFGRRSRSYYFYGDAGLGKTHLALAIAGGVLEQGFDVIYVSAQSAFAQLLQHRRETGRTGELFTSMLQAELLVLDDLGSEFLDAYVLSLLYELVNTRMGRRPTIYTSNITREDLLRQRYTEKIASRLLGECDPIEFCGEDLRLQRHG